MCNSLLYVKQVLGIRTLTFWGALYYLPQYIVRDRIADYKKKISVYYFTKFTFFGQAQGGAAPDGFWDLRSLTRE